MPDQPSQQPPEFHFPEVRVVEASAGSGKTYALAKRYLQLMFHPSLKNHSLAMRHILALTFTNKAAYEMKSRILQFLKGIALGAISDQEMGELLPLYKGDPKKAQEMAYHFLDQMIHHFNFFQVQTIDKFINAILSGSAFKIGLTAHFKIRTNAKDYLEYSLDQLITNAYYDHDLYESFQRFLHQYLYLENRSGWFPKKDILSIVTTLFDENNTYGLEFIPGPYKSEDIQKTKKQILAEIKRLEQMLPEETDARFLKSLENFIKAHEHSFDIDTVSDYFARETFPIRKGKDVPIEVEALWGSIHEGLHKLVEQEAFSLFNPYIDMYNKVKTALLEVTTREDILFLGELNKKAKALFDEEYMTVEELYYRLATRFHHYLIDEFQDTSRLQWQNLHLMAEEALSTGGSLFYVGDRKQAIYGFRGGDVRLFDDLKKGFSHFNVQVDRLTTNWRSQKNIVEFNNDVFSWANLKHFIEAKEEYETAKKKKNPVRFADDDYYQLQKIFGQCQQEYLLSNDGGYVQMEYIEEEKREKRDEIVREKLIGLLKGLGSRYALKDIAVLTRGNAEIELMTQWLLEEGFVVESERTSNVQEHPHIEEIVALMTFLNSPIDNQAFARFILGDIFTRATGLSREEYEAFIIQVQGTRKKDEPLYLYMAFRDKYPHLWERYLEEYFRTIGLYPLYELMVSVFGRLQCLKNFPETEGFFMHFLELIKKAEDENPDCESFLHYFEELQGEDLYVRFLDRNAIKLLTIHKSKGLEFPVVILPFLGMDIQVVSTSVDNKQSYLLRPGQKQMRLLRLKNKYLSYSEELYTVYREEYIQALLSELNNVYVALTRPREELYVFVPKKIGNSFNFLKLLIPENYFLPKEKPVLKGHYKEGLELDSHRMDLNPSQESDWIQYLKDEFLPAKNLQQLQIMQKGELIHALLGCLKSAKDITRKEIFQPVLQMYRTHAEKSEFEAAVQLTSHFVKSAQIQKFFESDQCQVFIEQEIINAVGHTKRIDRLMVFKEEVWICDFKLTDENRNQYMEQVLEYKRLVECLYPSQVVRGFLLYVTTNQYEEV
ncbi:MAG: UvrD-helicase domain-containing protein [Candidatus Omnitrophica bacterium]|nr:UvrD-helicase domain-containing protein [Candidatus Omnitrophota bacterium]